MNSPSQHTMTPANLLNHFSSGTSGSVSSQRASRMIWSHEMIRWRIRVSRWARSGCGSLWRRILGSGWGAVKLAFNLLLQPVGLRRVLGFDHPLGQLSKFLRSKQTALSHVSSKLDYPGLFIPGQALYLFEDLNRCDATL